MNGLTRCKTLTDRRVNNNNNINVFKVLTAHSIIIYLFEKKEKKEEGKGKC